MAAFFTAMKAAALLSTCLLPAALSTPYRNISEVMGGGMPDRQREALRYFTGVGRFGHSSGSSRELKAAFIGDSTTKYQYGLLCDLLKSEAVYEAEAGGGESAAGEENKNPHVCRGDGVAVVGHFKADGIIRADAINTILGRFHSKLAMPASEKFSFVYFGSSALHYMQLMPARLWKYDMQVTFEANLRQKLMAIRGATQCPIFHTMNHICDEKYDEEYAAAIRDPAEFEAKNKQKCSEFVQKARSQHPAAGSENAIRQHLAEVCWQFRFTAAGSENVVTKERSVMENASPPLRRIVDRFNTTRGQCWATNSGDGRHYLPLMPYAIKSVLSFATECLSGTNTTNTKEAK